MKAPSTNPILSSIFAQNGFTPPYIANFDSASGMLRATGAYLRGEDFPGIGVVPSALEPIADLITQLPRSLQEQIYIAGSAGEAIPPEQLEDVRAEVVAKWMVNEYPQRSYPAVAIGSSCGALVNLCAALGIPWLPQTYLIPVKHGGEINIDEPKQALNWGRERSQALLENNPELILHQMHDPCQDRLTSQGMAYFRVKRLLLGETYERFLQKTLPPGGTIFLVECQRTWPTTKVSDRHIFQFGALGGATPEEFLHGSERVEDYLERYNSHRRKWDAPKPDGERPEAEWGFEAQLRHDVERFAQERGYHVRRIIFTEPEDLSPFVAELYRWWYKQRQIVTNCLLVESFLLTEPMWTLKTGSVPFWMKFNKQPSLDALENYLDSTDPYDEIYLMLFSHGVDSIGLPSIERWRRVFEKAKIQGNFVGVDEEKYPRHFSSMIRYHTDLKRLISARYPLPSSLKLEQLDQFIEQEQGNFRVKFT
ncbi:hypothetical protein ACL6C3_09480 [Capilliphycus salinus ALCB114379]|uniref:hypothetical protein n=1 Tax=Capilliphycus salinus TaxID=2768948 RepID=UPI0039A58F9F